MTTESGPSETWSLSQTNTDIYVQFQENTWRMLFWRWAHIKNSKRRLKNTISASVRDDCNWVFGIKKFNIIIDQSWMCLQVTTQQTKPRVSQYIAWCFWYWCLILIKIQTLQNYCNSTQTLHREVSRMSSSFVELIKTRSLSFTLDQSILGNFAFNTFNGKKRNKQ